MSPSPSPPPPLHGGDVHAAARRLGVRPEQILDFSANLSFTGPPRGLRAALLRGLDQVPHYPDPACWDLRQALAAHLGLEAECILAGNGSTELIYLLARALGASQALVVSPAFAEYGRALDLAGASLSWLATSENQGFVLRDPLPPARDAMIMLANPASPSGGALAPEELLALAQPALDSGAWLVVDEAFVDFAPQLSLHAHLARHPRLVLLRSFTKFFAIPGLRLGHVLAAPDVIERLAQAQEPWSVGSLAQTAGLACLAARGYARRTIVAHERERAFLARELTSFPGCGSSPAWSTIF